LRVQCLLLFQSKFAETLAGRSRLGLLQGAQPRSHTGPAVFEEAASFERMDFGAGLNLSSSPSAMEAQVALMATGNITPQVLALQKKMLDMIGKDMKPAVQKNHEKIQIEMNDTIKGFDICPEQGEKEGQPAMDKFTSARSAHVSCRAGEVTAYKAMHKCNKEHASEPNATKALCNAVTALDKTQGAIQSTCASSTGESYLSQVKRLANVFNSAVKTYEDQTRACSAQQTKEASKTNECKAAKGTYDSKKAECDKAQANMDSSSCDYKVAALAGCDACYNALKKSLDDKKAKNWPEQQQALEQEMGVLLRMECYLSTIEKTSYADRKKAIDACTQKASAAGVGIGALSLAFPSAPAKKCTEPAGLAGSAKYKASYYDTLPANAPATTCSASCCSKPDPLETCNLQKDPSGMTGEKRINIPASKVNGNFDLAVLIETGAGNGFCSGSWLGMMGGDCHTMGLWFQKGFIRNERQCGPHPGTSNIPCSKLSSSTKYWITLSRRGTKGIMKVFEVGSAFQKGTLVASSEYRHIAPYRGVQTLGEAQKGSERFNGKIFCLQDSLPE